MKTHFWLRKRHQTSGLTNNLFITFFVEVKWSYVWHFIGHIKHLFNWKLFLVKKFATFSVQFVFTFGCDSIYRFFLARLFTKLWQQSLLESTLLQAMTHLVFLTRIVIHLKQYDLIDGLLCLKYQHFDLTFATTTNILIHFQQFYIVWARLIFLWYLTFLLFTGCLRLCSLYNANDCSQQRLHIHCL